MSKVPTRIKKGAESMGVEGINTRVFKISERQKKRLSGKKKPTHVWLGYENQTCVGSIYHKSDGQM